MLKIDKGDIHISGDAQTVLAEFLTLASAMYQKCYKRVYEGQAKDKYFEQIILTTLSDKEFNEYMKNEVKKNGDTLADLFKDEE